MKTAARKIRKMVARALSGGLLGQDQYATIWAGLNHPASVEDFMDTMVRLEAYIADLINYELTFYDTRVRLDAQNDRSAEIFRLADLMFGAYAALFSDVDQLVRRSANPHIAGLVALMTVQDPGNRSGRKFLGEVKSMLIVSFLMGAQCPEGARLVEKLVATNQPINIQVIYKEHESSLLAYAQGMSNCLSGPSNPADSIRTRVKSANSGAVGGTNIGVPLWLTNGQSAGMELANSFSMVDRREGLLRVLHGSISFNREAYPFFTPARIELLHECIHALHNARGMNRVNVNSMKDGERHIWHTAEEYWTIDGGNINENHFNAQIGSPLRYGHGGLPLTGLLPGSDYIDRTLRELSGLF